MANKIIYIGETSKPEDKYRLEVYKDISMVSKNKLENNQTEYQVDKNVNAKAVMGSIHNIFSWIPGERILLPEFGSRLRTLLYEGITQQTEEQIVAEIRGLVSEWEPRANIVEIRNISDNEDTEDNTIHLEIIFTVNGLDDQQYSYSFEYNRDNSI